MEASKSVKSQLEKIKGLEILSPEPMMTVVVRA